MNWMIVVFSTIPVMFILGIILERSKRTSSIITIACLMAVCCGIILGIGLPLGLCKQNIHDKYDWYMETRLKYAEAEGIEKKYIELNDVMDYNLCYSRNQEDLENPWNFKSAAGCEFDYIKIGD